MRLPITSLISPLPVILFLSISSCSKVGTQKCEEWEITDERFNIGGCIDWSCSGSRTLKLIFCGTALTDAKEGNTIVLSEDQCCKKTRTFVRFIKKL